MAIEEAKLRWCYHFEFTVLLLLFLMSFLVMQITSSSGTTTTPPQQQLAVPCFFIFGDSYVDNGNNNNLVTGAKSNYLPYGIDFPDGPTGRFTNGRTFMDFIGQYLGFDEFIPPFATAEGEVIINGVNYASAASGIRDDTGSSSGDRFSMNMQLLNHNTTRTRLANLLGNHSTANEHLMKCLYAVHTGGNDYKSFSFAPRFYNTSKLYTLEEYTGVLIRLYFRQIKALHDYGARKVVLFGLGPNYGPRKVVLFGHGSQGCLPLDELKTDREYETVSCGDQRVVQMFNQNLKALVDRLNRRLPDAKFIFINTSGIVTTDPSARGYSSEPCCKVAGIGLCIPEQIPCSNRALHLHWDDLHFTEIVNRYISIRSYTSLLPSDAYPTSIRQLVQNS